MRAVILISVIALTTSGCIGLAARAVAEPRKPDFAQLLDRADTNNDGVITRAEFTDARAKLFARLDRNQDGFIDKDDKPRFSLRSGKDDRIAQLILLLDKDGDGRISRAEFVDSPSLIFDRADTNHDGVIDKAELAAFRTATAARQ